MDKQAKLDVITQQIEECELCKIDKVGKAVPGEGNPDADVVFIGEAPGKTEAATGRPFIGRSGKLLRKLIAEAGLTDDEVYITSPVKRLPTYVTPKPADIAHGKVHLDAQLAVIEPKVIVMLGSVAAQALLGEKIPVSTRHGEIIEKDGRKYFVTVHPAAALRFTKMRNLLLEDFKKLKVIIS